MNEWLLLLLVFSPLLGILLLLFVKEKQGNAVKMIGVASTLPALAISLYLFLRHKGGTVLSQYDVRFDWFRFGNFEMYDANLYAVRFELGIDGFALVMVVLTSFLCTLSAIASWQIKSSLKNYYLLFLILQVGMLGVFAAENLILFFLFFEITLVPMFFLIGKWGYGKRKRAAFTFLIYNGLGSVLLLMVIIILFAKTGTSNIAVLQQVIPNGGITLIANISPELKQGLFITLLLAFGVKLPVFPLHTWMVHVHVQAPPPVVMLHAGVLLKIGAYGLIQFGIGIFPEQFMSLSGVIIVLGLINLLYGAFIALVQKDFKMVLAYSSISHMGIVLIGLGAGNEAGLQGAVFQVISHGLIAALLFCIVGMIYSRLGTSELLEMGGIAKSMPILSGFLLAGGLASLGLPGMSGFVGEITVFIGIFAKEPLLAGIGAIGLVLTAAYMLRAVLSITFGEMKQTRLESMRDPSGSEYIPLLALLISIILLGVAPEIAASSFRETITAIFVGIGG